MRKVLGCLFYLGMIGGIAGILQEAIVEAGVRRDAVDNIVLGEWQPSHSTGGKGHIILVKDFTPGKKLMARILLEHPGETVIVKLIIEAPGKPIEKLEKTVQDNDSHDLSNQASAIILELTEIPIYPVARYIVTVDDRSGKDSVIKILEGPTDPPTSVGTSVMEKAKMLWEFPGNLASLIFGRERTATEIFQTLVVADTNGKVLNTLTPSQGSEIQSPIWLTNEQILFVEKHKGSSILKVISAHFDNPAKDFGNKVEGEEPHLTPYGQSIIFLHRTTLISADLSGKQFVSLVKDKEVIQILGIFPDIDTSVYNLVFSARKPDIPVLDLWLAKIRGTDVIWLDSIPYNSHWFLLAQARIYKNRLLYEQRDKRSDGRQVWNIYLSQSLKEDGVKITSDEHNDRDPAWSLDGTKIVFVSDRKE
jgi:ethanolamine utilization microcompartment shell protein EutS